MTKNILPRFLAVALALAVAAHCPAGEPGEVLGNADIVEMVRANVSELTIIAKINSTPGRFDTSTTSIIAMQSNGVPDTVINAMLAASAAAASPARLDEGRYRNELAAIASGAGTARLEALAWMQTNRAQTVPLLRQSLTDRLPETRSAALAALGQLRDIDSLPAIRPMIADNSPEVRRVAAKVLSDLNDSQAIVGAETALQRRLSPLDGYVRLIGHARITRVADNLGQILSSSGEVPTRVAAAWAIGEIGRPAQAARPALEKALDSDPDPGVRREAAAALAKFHDTRTARLLEDACRKDYEVRKITLSAMAEYPETVEFLVGVMNLGTDQIAVDELETARDSLSHLTGQNFGLDGGRWSEWYGANRSRFPSGGSQSPLGQPAPAAIAVGGTPAPAARQVDVEAWNLIADADQIPMAIGVEGASAGRPAIAGMPNLPIAAPAASPVAAGPAPAPAVGYTPVPNPPNLPSAPSPRDFEAATPDLTGLLGGAGQIVPSTMPTMDFESGTLAGGDDADADLSAPMFQSWSSDPKRRRGDEDDMDDDPAQAARGGEGGVSPYGRDLFGPDTGDAEISGGPGRSPSGLMPSTRVVGPVSPVDTASESQEMRGIALVLPGMEGMMESAPPAQPAASPEAEPTAGQSATFEVPPSYLMGDAEDGAPMGDGMSQMPAPSLFESAPGTDDAFSGVGVGTATAEPEMQQWEDGLFGTSYPDASAAPGAVPFADSAPPADTVFAPPPAAAGSDAGAGAPMLLLGVDDAAAAPAAPSGLQPPEFLDTAESAPTAVSGTDGGESADAAFLPVFDAVDETAGGGMPQPPMDAGAAGAVPETAQTVEPYGSSLFVEPEPGQEVIGDVLLTPEAMVMDSGGTTYSAPAETYDSAPYTPYVPYEASEPDAAPAGTVVVESQPAPPVVQDTRSPAEIYFEATRSGEAHIPPELYPKPAPAAQSDTPGSQPPAGPSTADYFTDPSAPRPPVRREGTVTAPQGKDMPPMLGEGLFEKESRRK